MKARKAAAVLLVTANTVLVVAHSLWQAACDWFWNGLVFRLFERFPVHERTPEQQAEYVRQGRLSDERARVAWMERERKRREETP